MDFKVSRREPYPTRPEGEAIVHAIPSLPEGMFIATTKQGITVLTKMALKEVSVGDIQTIEEGDVIAIAELKERILHPAKGKNTYAFTPPVWACMEAKSKSRVEINSFREVVDYSLVSRDSA
ncbi:MAG TPA: hypothetical protein VMR76_01535 [Candidatus Saccharimonadia bacterium]|nr:hypothetical protein [Candidatus Saccharimonadia bacterium]